MSKYIFVSPSNYAIDDNSPKTEYQQNLKLNNIHWGQLKLFCNEMIFLNLYFDESDGVRDVVYVGAAGGYHLELLANLFPTLHFHLFDTEKFHLALYSMPNVTVHNRYFDEQDVNVWKDKKCYFISDIRGLGYDSSKTDVKEKEKNEELVWKDMLLQQSWVEEIKPRYSMLKFRLPYAEKFILEKGKTREYLDGVVYLQPFCKRASSETRLVIDGENLFSREWDLLDYEQRLAFHNKIVRAHKKFQNPLGKSKLIHSDIGLYDDYDSTAFTYIMLDYMKKVNMDRSPSVVKKFLEHVLSNIKKGTTLLSFR